MYYGIVNHGKNHCLQWPPKTGVVYCHIIYPPKYRDIRLPYHYIYMCMYIYVCIIYILFTIYIWVVHIIYTIGPMYAIYGNMDPINIPQSCSHIYIYIYIYHTWIMGLYQIIYHLVI